MRAAIANGTLPGPRLFTGGRLVTSPDGHPVSTIWPTNVSRHGTILASDEGALIEGLERNYAGGTPDCVKFIHGTIGRAKEELSAALLAGGVAWAHAHQLQSVVHAETANEVEDALRAGAEDVEHTAYLEDLPASLAALIEANRPFLDPTFGEYKTRFELDDWPKEKREAALKTKYAMGRGRVLRRPVWTMVAGEIVAGDE